MNLSASLINMSNIMYPLVSNLSRQLNDLLNQDNNKYLNKKQTIYVIGNGWGSYYFTKNLDKNKYNPIIIAPNTKVLNTPRLTERLTNPDANVEFDNPNGTIVEDILEDIDLENKLLITKSGSQYKYDKVVLSIGSEPNDFGIPGVNEHAYKFKTIQDADLLRERIEKLYTDSLVYIVGTGITGIEIASRLNNFGYRIRMIEGLGEILQGYKDKTKHLVLDDFHKHKNTDIHFNEFVKSIDYSGLNNTGFIKTFNNLNKTTNSYPFNWNNRYKADIVIWTGGVRFCGYGQTRLFKTLNQIVPIKPRGLDVSEDFTIDPDKQIYCIGDMVANKGPSSAQNAKNQAKWLAGYFNFDFDSSYLKSNPYKVESKGKLVHLDKTIILESDYYVGNIPKSIDKLIEFFQI